MRDGPATVIVGGQCAAAQVFRRTRSQATPLSAPTGRLTCHQRTALLGLHEILERHAAEIHAGVSCHRQKTPRFALDHVARPFPSHWSRRRCSRQGVHPGSPGLEPDVECQARNAVDDVLGGAWFRDCGRRRTRCDASERNLATRRRCDDLAEEVPNVDAKIGFDLLSRRPRTMTSSPTAGASVSEGARTTLVPARARSQRCKRGRQTELGAKSRAEHP